MRIRKRLASWPPSSSTANPLAPSAPPYQPLLESLHHHNYHRHGEAKPCNPPNNTAKREIPLPSTPQLDLQPTLVKKSNGWICNTDGDCMHPIKEPQGVQLKHPGEEKSSSLIHVSNKSSCGVKEDRVSISSSSSHQGEKWFKENTNITPTGRWTFQEGNGKEMNETSEGVSEMIKKKRKKVDRDSVMTEGSQCSRVNGRGWRCFRPTLVGYSLCEHHSTRGKLKSKSEKQGTMAFSSTSSGASSSPLLNEKPLMTMKKKIGTAKARSISSLLVQTQVQPAPPLVIPAVDSLTTL